MNKYLISFLLVFIVFDAMAVVPTKIFGTQTVAMVCDYNNINLSDIKDTPAHKYRIDNSVVLINDFADWQNWNANVEFGTNVYLDIKNLSSKNNGQKIEHVSNTDVVNVFIRDADKLYKVNFSAAGSDLFFNLERETDYKKVFKDSRGAFLENIRLNHPDDKMLSAMDSALTMTEINSVMNSSYHFNPIILMNPVKTLNRAVLIDFLSEANDGVGADVDYMFSNKINNYGGRVYVANKYNDLFFKIGLNFNRFSYSDNFNDFDGIAYGLDVRAKQYIKSFWLDGILGINRSVFNADNIYVNGDISDNPKGMSEYARISIGYDIKRVSDFVLSPFAGLMFQKSDIMGLSDSDINLHTGITGKYNFVMDGIKYEYGASVATDEKANWNLETKVGFMSVEDNAGAYFGIGAFCDEFGTNYKLSINGKMYF
jgi:hypothetical protein